MNKMNLMKSAVTIVLLLFMIHSLNYIYTALLNVEHFETDELDLKLEKSLETAFERFSSMSRPRKEAMGCMQKK